MGYFNIYNTIHTSICNVWKKSKNLDGKILRSVALHCRIRYELRMSRAIFSCFFSRASEIYYTTNTIYTGEVTEEAKKEYRTEKDNKVVSLFFFLHDLYETVGFYLRLNLNYTSRNEQEQQRRV